MAQQSLVWTGTMMLAHKLTSASAAGGQDVPMFQARGTKASALWPPGAPPSSLSVPKQLC